MPHNQLMAISVWSQALLLSHSQDLTKERAKQLEEENYKKTVLCKSLIFWNIKLFFFTSFYNSKQMIKLSVIQCNALQKHYTISQ